uniref:Serine protease 6 n=1 Tax=Sogatella furcifera TaxID=113103 RepID=A0A2S1TNS2_SOGFU|nr:serine protease 6 [Sogatella furcifera]
MHLQGRTNCVLALLTILWLSHSGYCKAGTHYASIKQFPFQVSVEMDKTHYCGGAIVGDQWVVTARHCIPQNTSEVDRVKVRAGSSYLGSGGAFHSVNKLVGFKRRTSYDSSYRHINADISMIKVETPFYYSPYVQWSNPNLEEPETNMKFTAAGYTKDKKKTKTRLQMVSLKSLKKEECNDMFQGKVNITGELGCFVGATKKDDTCKLNVGTPIGADGLIYAIILNTDYCKSNRHPIIVTQLENSSGALVQTMAEFIPRKIYETDSPENDIK